MKKRRNKSRFWQENVSCILIVIFSCTGIFSPLSKYIDAREDGNVYVKGRLVSPLYDGISENNSEFRGCCQGDNRNDTLYFKPSSICDIDLMGPHCLEAGEYKDRPDGAICEENTGNTRKTCIQSYRETNSGSTRGLCLKGVCQDLVESPRIHTFTMNGIPGAYSANPGETVKLAWSISGAEKIDFSNANQFDESRAEGNINGGWEEFPVRESDTIYLDAYKNTQADRAFWVRSRGELNLTIKPLNFQSLTYAVTGEKSANIFVVAEGAKYAVLDCDTTWFRSCTATSIPFNGSSKVVFALSDIDINDTWVTIKVFGPGDLGYAPSQTKDVKIGGPNLAQCMGDGLKDHFTTDSSTVQFWITWPSFTLCSLRALTSNPDPWSMLSGVSICLAQEGLSGMQEGVEDQRCAGSDARFARGGILTGQIVTQPIPAGWTAQTNITALLSKIVPLDPFSSSMIIVGGFVIIGGVIAMFNADYEGFANNILSIMRVIAAIQDFLDVFDKFSKWLNNFKLLEEPPIKPFTPSQIENTVPSVPVVDPQKGGTIDKWVDPPKIAEKQGPALTGRGWDGKGPDAFQETISNFLQIACAVRNQPTTKDKALAHVKKQPITKQHDASMIGLKVIDWTHVSGEICDEVINALGGCPQ